MKFSIALSDFARSLQQILPAIPPKSTLYVLEHVHCSLSNGTLTLLATDQELSVSTSMNVMSSEGGEVLIPARKLNELVRSLGQGSMVDISVDMESYLVTLRTATGEYFIKGMDVSEFPVLPEFPQGTSVTLTKAAVQRIANKTTFAVSTEEYRPAMTGVYFEFNGDELISVATDGYRLVKLTTAAEGQIFPENLHAIIPARTVNLLAKAESDVVLAINKTHAQFSNDITTITTRLIDEKFPNYDNVIPKDNDKVCTVAQSSLVSAIRRVSLFTSTVSPQVRFAIKEDMIQVSAEDSESGNKAKEVVPAEFASEPMDIGFNYRYIEESLQHISADDMTDGVIDILLSSPTRAVLIKPKAEKDTLLMLVMPMRIS
jgi:DNA polymerase-3 subunit beta